MSDNAVISVKNLKTYFYTNERCNRAINGVSMDIKSGKTLCIVGESGCGKSVTATSIMQLLPSFPGSRKGKSSITAETSAVILRSTNWKETEKR